MIKDLDDCNFLNDEFDTLTHQTFEKNPPKLKYVAPTQLKKKTDFQKKLEEKYGEFYETEREFWKSADGVELLKKKFKEKSEGN